MSAAATSEGLMNEDKRAIKVINRVPGRHVARYIIFQP